MPPIELAPSSTVRRAPFSIPRCPPTVPSRTIRYGAAGQGFSGEVGHGGASQFPPDRPGSTAHPRVPGRPRFSTPAPVGPVSMPVDRCPTGVPSIDAILGGGLEADCLTELYGEGGSGKTLLCLEVATRLALTDRWVVYIDTEGVSVDRLEAIAGGRLEAVLKRLLLASPKSLEEQTRAVTTAGQLAREGRRPIGLIVLDSATFYYRLTLAGPEEDEGRLALVEELAELMATALNCGVPVLFTNQVWRRQSDGSLEPLGGSFVNHAAKTILRLDRLAGPAAGRSSSSTAPSPRRPPSSGSLPAASPGRSRRSPPLPRGPDRPLAGRRAEEFKSAVGFREPMGEGARAARRRNTSARQSSLEYADLPTPIGTFRVVYRGATVQLVDLIERGVAASPTPEGADRRRPPFERGSPPAQLQEYFRGRLDHFAVEVDLDGATPFDRGVWTALQKVGPGSTITYGALARRSGHAGAARAVGGSMHRNPIPIIIPCHRVVGTEGSLTGYGLGLWRKRWLLDREGAWPIRSKSAEGPKDATHQRTLDGVLGSEGPGRRAPATPRSSSRRMVPA